MSVSVHEAISVEDFSAFIILQEQYDRLKDDFNTVVAMRAEDEQREEALKSEIAKLREQIAAMQAAWAEYDQPERFNLPGAYWLPKLRKAFLVEHERSGGA